MTSPAPINKIEMVRRIWEANYERLKNATLAERLAFYNRAAQVAASRLPPKAAQHPA